MHIEEFRNYCLKKPHATEHFPFDEVTLVFKVGNKIFALSGLERNPPEVNLKCEPERAMELREEFDGDIIPGFHMNKHHWNTLKINNLPNNLIEELIDHSYNLIVDSLPKKIKDKLI